MIAFPTTSPTLENMFLILVHTSLKNPVTLPNTSLILSTPFWNVSLKKFPTDAKMSLISCHKPLNKSLIGLITCSLNQSATLPNNSLTLSQNEVT